MKLTKKQKAAVERWCYAELAELAGNDYGDPFKDRYETQPDELTSIAADDSEYDGEVDELSDAADDYFFVVMAKLAKDFRKRSKGK